jgi:hypothetical protein
MGMLDEIEAGELEENKSTLRSLIPGYEYKRKEKRAETDRELRDKVIREIRKAKSNLDRVSDMAYDDGRRDIVDEISDVTDSLLRLESKAESGPTSGLLNGVNTASEKDLIRLVELDAKLVRDSEVLSEASDRLEEAVLEERTEDIQNRLRELRKTADDIERAFEDRKDLLSGL